MTDAGTERVRLFGIAGAGSCGATAHMPRPRPATPAAGRMLSGRPGSGRVNPSWRGTSSRHPADWHRRRPGGRRALSGEAPAQPAQEQEYPGVTGKMRPRPRDEMRDSTGSGLLDGKKALITGGDSGIGRAVAVAFAKEGADVAVAYLSEAEDADAERTADLVRQAGRRCLRRCGRPRRRAALHRDGRADRRGAGRAGRGRQQRGGPGAGGGPGEAVD